MSKTPLIAVVDDDEAVRDALLNLLQVEGLGAEGYPSAIAFLTAFPSRDFDCLVTDIRMDGMDGLELQRRVRLANPAIPVIFVTASSDDATRIRAVNEGATAYFTKPLANAELMQQLFRALRRQAGC